MQSNHSSDSVTSSQWNPALSAQLLSNCHTHDFHERRAERFAFGLAPRESLVTCFSSLEKRLHLRSQIMKKTENREKQMPEERCCPSAMMPSLPPKHKCVAMSGRSLSLISNNCTESWELGVGLALTIGISKSNWNVRILTISPGTTHRTQDATTT